MGVLLAWLVWRLVFHYNVFDVIEPGTWIGVIFALLLAPYVVNIGFGVTWGAWPRIAGIVVLAAGALIGYLNEGTIFGLPLWWSTLVFTAYVYAHLSVSFLLSAVLATPGCEMRAIPHLLSIARGTSADEHYCPGFIDNVDRWERDLKQPEEQRGNPALRDDDLIRNGTRLLLFYGLPVAAIQLTGFVGGRTVAAVVWTAGFAVMGLVGVANAVRTRRVSGFFTGPWFLLTAAAVAAHYFGLLDVSGPVVLNVGLFGGVLLYWISENIWGKYFGEDQRATSA